ncbi:neuronal PAS domain-containing protein 4A [Morone saxatilis]|uniref:neuronal PAS domain-containing protein 4A n=1 Tax=Morone saxatilis TaxID=34816 RepID=UPI0015E215B1|nr:neuronal PAS domain-containing protein 4A [Morone saxatilis]
MYRSTKGASKARRDQINAEIRNLKDLLPISDADKARLSYLHIMSLACMYTRKSVFFTQGAGTAASLEESAGFLSFHELSELMQALPGFLMLLTGEGKLLYLSDSVSDHLGHSMVDLVAQGDSVYDIIDASDHFIMRTNLSTSTSLEMDRLFRCRFNTSKSVRRQSAGNKLVLIRARCLSPPITTPAAGSYWTSNPVWVCFCSPLEPHPTRSGPGAERESTSAPPLADTNLFLACFYSQHGRDLRLQTAQDSVSAYLGFDVTALRSRSWYSLLHPQDLSHASAQHRSLLREGGEGRAEMVVRVQALDQSWVWLYMVLQLQPGEIPISSNNYIISDSEAWSVRQQLGSEQTQLTLVLSAGTSQQEGLSLQSPETLSSPDQVFTPGSSGLSAQSFDFSTAGCSVGSSDEPGSSAAEAMQLEGDPRSSISSLEEESFFQQHPTESPSAASSPTPVTVETVADLDFLTQNILLPPSFQLDPPLPALPLPLPPVPTSQAQQTKEFVCTPPYTPQISGASFPFGEPLFSFDPTGTTTPPPSATTTTATTSLAPAASSTAPPTTTSSPAPPREREKERAEISLLAQHISSLAEGFYLDPLLSKLSPPSMSPSSSPPSPFLSPTIETADVDSVHMLREFYPIKTWRGLDIPMFLDDDDSLFEESILETLLQDDFTPPQPTGLSSPSPSTSPMPNPSSPTSSQTPVCWRQPSQFEGVGHFCSVQSAQCNSMAGCGATVAAEAGANMEGEGLAEEAMEIEVVSSPVSSCSSIPASPPLILTASPSPATSTPIASPTPAVSCTQSLLEELAVLEPMFGAGASIAPGLGQQPELYQLQCHPSPQCFHKDGSGSVPPF